MRTPASSPYLGARVYADFSGLAALRTGAARGDARTLREAAEQFEAVFVQMMLKSMRSAKLAEDPYAGPQADLYTDLLDRQLAIDMAARQGLGLADAIVRQLGGDDAPAPPRSAPAAAGEPTEAAAAPGRAGDAPSFASPADFVARLWPHAERAARRLGTRPEVLLAQAALETGWGARVIRRPDGASSHNLFNVKADGRWGGERVTVETVEYRDGVAVRERAAFRAYESWAEAFDDYADFLLASPRYAAALARADDAEGFVRALAEGGYATDPRYADKVLGVLGRIRAGLKSASAAPIGRG